MQELHTIGTRGEKTGLPSRIRKIAEGGTHERQKRPSSTLVRNGTKEDEDALFRLRKTYSRAGPKKSAEEGKLINQLAKKSGGSGGTGVAINYQQFPGQGEKGEKSAVGNFEAGATSALCSTVLKAGRLKKRGPTNLQHPSDRAKGTQNRRGAHGPRQFRERNIMAWVLTRVVS